MHPVTHTLTGFTDLIAEEVQEALLGILGFDDMDFVQELLTYREDIAQALV